MTSNMAAAHEAFVLEHERLKAERDALKAEVERLKAPFECAYEKGHDDTDGNCIHAFRKVEAENARLRTVVDAAKEIVHCTDCDLEGDGHMTRLVRAVRALAAPQTGGDDV